MLRLKRAQRTLLAETLRDIANLAAGAMIFGQFLADAVFSQRVALGGMFLWIVLVLCAAAHPGGTVVNNMANVFIMLGGIAVFAVVVTLLDWLGRRQERSR